MTARIAADTEGRIVATDDGTVYRPLRCPVTARKVRPLDLEALKLAFPPELTPPAALEALWVKVQERMTD